MKIAIDAHNLLSDWRGIARYVGALVPRLAAVRDVELVLLTQKRFFARAALARVLGMTRFRVAHAVPRDADVVWHPWNGTFFPSSRPAVVTMHDTAPFAFPAADPARRASEQEPLRRSAATARAFITDSQASAAEMERHLSIDPARITVIPLAVEHTVYCADGPREALPDGRPFVLFAGAHDERKNIATLIAAHAKAFPDGDVALAATGSAVGGGAVSLGHLEPAHVPGWYRGALAVAVPSVYEGFGLPLLEAMACGTPVIASRTSSLPEVGGDAPLWVDDPHDVGAWVSALRRVAAETDLRERMGAAGLRQAALFSWDACAEATLAVLRSAAS